MSSAGSEEEHLLRFKAVEFGVEGGGFDLEDRDDGEQAYEAEEYPVEVAIGGEAGHSWLLRAWGFGWDGGGVGRLGLG